MKAMRRAQTEKLVGLQWEEDMAQAEEKGVVPGLPVGSVSVPRAGTAC